MRGATSAAPLFGKKVKEIAVVETATRVLPSEWQPTIARCKTLQRSRRQRGFLEQIAAVETATRVLPSEWQPTIARVKTLRKNAADTV